MMLLIVSPPLTMWLQQHLPFTVLKRWKEVQQVVRSNQVATTPTVYGIETSPHVGDLKAAKSIVATTPTVYGIETCNVRC